MYSDENRNEIILEMLIESILIRLMEEATDRVALSEREYAEIYENTFLYSCRLLHEFPNLLRETPTDLQAIESNIEESALRVLTAQYKNMKPAKIADMSKIHAFVFTRELLRELPTVAEFKYIT